MKVKFLVDYKTEAKEYKKDTSYDVDDDIAFQYIKHNIAEEVKPVKRDSKGK